MKIKYTTSNSPIDHKAKITYNSFLKSVWELSNTNLHYHDFKAVHEESLRAIYKPVKIN